ncbi:MAG TPA: hypothetical protein VH590_01825 [Ktedonobacterales bacterium]
MVITSPRPLSTSDQEHAAADARLAVLRALAYSDVFDYAPDRSALYDALEYPGISRARFEQTLQEMQTEGSIIADDERCMLAGREALSAIWRRRQHCSARKWQSARRYTRLIRCLPCIRMVAVTGTLAAHSAEADDDIDLFLITTPGRVWLARALTVAVVRLAALFGVTLCPNYLIATDALELSEHNLYAARELVQMQPLYGAAWYHQFRAHNPWTLDYLPNASIAPAPAALPLDLVFPPARLCKWLGERLLGGKIGNALERWEMRRKVRKFLHERTPAVPEEASFSSAQCKGHFEGHAARILQCFHERVAALLADQRE